jgi:hypothetical protein
MNQVIKVRHHKRSTNQDKGCWWLKAKPAAGDLASVHLCRSAKRPTLRSAGVDGDRGVYHACIKMHAAFSGRFITR